MLSGIGPAEQLAELGIEVRIDLPGSAGTCTTTSRPRIVPGQPRRQIPGLKGRLSRRSVPSLGTLRSAVLVHPSPTDRPPDSSREAGSRSSAALCPEQPSVSLTLTSTDPTAHADPRYHRGSRCGAAHRGGGDRAGPGLGVAVRTHGGERRSPGGRRAEQGRTAGLRGAHRADILPPRRTCKMGVGTDSVVDPLLRVHGTANLRIADARLIPTSPPRTRTPPQP